MRIFSVVLALVLTAWSTPLAHAQQQATVSVFAIMEEAVVVQTIRNLDFAVLTPGLGSTVVPDDLQPTCGGCASGLWEFSALTNNPQMRSAVVTFDALPATLVHPSGATLPVTWGSAGRACLIKNNTAPYCYGSFTPAAGSSHAFEINGRGPGSPPSGGQRTLQLFLGGTATPSSGQRAGHYHGTVRVTFAYSAL